MEIASLLGGDKSIKTCPFSVVCGDLGLEIRGGNLVESKKRRGISPRIWLNRRLDTVAGRQTVEGGQCLVPCSASHIPKTNHHAATSIKTITNVSVSLPLSFAAGMVMACSMNVGSKSRARFSKFLVVRDAERRREKPRCVALNILASQVEEGSHSIHNCLAVWPPS